MARVVRTTIVLLSVISVVASCAAGDEGGEKADTPLQSDGSETTGEAPVTATTTRPPADAEAFCGTIAKVALEGDVQPELDLLCKGGTAAPLMLRLRDAAVASDGKGNVPVEVIHRKSDPAAQQTEMILVWAYVTGLVPETVKERPINEYISRPFDQDGIITTGETGAQERDGEGLRVWSAPTKYGLRVTTEDGVDLESKRETRYDMYQLSAASEEMGIGVEQLDGENADYKRSVMLNLTFVDGNAQTVIVNLLHVVLDDRGFPETAERAIRVTSEGLARALFDGLQP